MRDNSTGRWKPFLWAVCVASAALCLGGCLNNKINVKQTSVQFNDRSDKIALRAGLYMDDATRNWVYHYKKMGVSYAFALGQALEADAPVSLQKSFQDVALLASADKAGSGVDRIVTLKFGPGTSWQLAPIVMAANHATVEILCEVSDKSGKLLWSGSAVGHADETAGASGYLTGFMNSWLNKAYGRIFNDAVTAALEKLNDQLLSSGKASIAG